MAPEVIDLVSSPSSSSSSSAASFPISITSSSEPDSVEEIDIAPRQPRGLRFFSICGSKSHCGRGTRATCEACRLRQLNEKEDLETHPTLEAFMEDAWWDVEEIRKQRSKGEHQYIVRCIGFNFKYEEEVEPHRIRPRSRRATIADCSRLKPGTDVCVFVLHPRTKDKAWYDGSIQIVENKSHEKGVCKCRFTVHLYRIGDTLRPSDDMKMLTDRPQVVGIDRVKILRAPYNMSAETVLEAAVRPGSARRQWFRDIGLLKDKRELQVEIRPAEDSESEEVEIPRRRRGYHHWYDLPDREYRVCKKGAASEDESYCGSSDNETVAEDMTDFISFLEHEVDVESDHPIMISEDTDADSEARKRKADLNFISRSKRRQRKDIQEGARRARRRLYEVKRKRWRFNKDTPNKKRHRGEEGNSSNKARSRKRRRRASNLDEEDTDDELEVQQGYVVSLDDYWRRQNSTEEAADTRTAEEAELEKIWTEMKMVFRKNTTLELDEKVQQCAFGGEHDFVMDDHVGLVCSQCGYIGIHIDQLAHRPELMYKEWHPPDESVDEDISAEQDPDKPLEDLEEIFITSKGILKEMHLHQKQAIGFLKRNIVDEKAGCILAHSPGTGKTFTTIAFYSRLKELNPRCRLLVLAPKAVLKAWKREFKKWNVHIQVHLLQSLDHRTRRLDILREWHKERSVLVMSYSLFVSLGDSKGISRKQSKKKRRDLSSYVLQSPDLLILDEGHNLKNNKTYLRRTLMNVRTKLRILLSGTLFQNNFQELFNIMYLVRPDFIRKLDCYVDFEMFGELEQNPDRLEDLARKWFMQEIGAKFNQGNKRELDAARDKLINMTRSFIDHYKGEILNKLPGLHDYVVTVELTDAQVDALESVSRVLLGIEGEIACTLACIHPYLLGTMKFWHKVESVVRRQTKDIRASVRMEFVVKMIEVCQATSEKVLVFSENIAPLDFLMEFLESKLGWSLDKQVLRITGSSSPSERQALFERFNKETDESRVCLGSIKSCAEGVTLTGASRVIFLNTLWNSSLTQQAISRAYRMGQQRHVFVYRLVASLSAEIRKNLRTVWKDWVADTIFSQPDDGTNKVRKSAEIFDEDTLLKELNDENPGWIIKVVHRDQGEEEHDQLMAEDRGQFLIADSDSDEFF